MKYLINNSTDPYFNLAFDEYCLENIQSEEPYFFLWRNRPSVIIGLNQNNPQFARHHAGPPGNRWRGRLSRSPEHELHDHRQESVPSADGGRSAQPWRTSRADRPQRHIRGRKKGLRLCPPCLPQSGDHPRHADV